MKKEELEAENAILRLQLETLYNGSSYSADAIELDPEIENTFLKNVIAFEQQVSQCRRISLAEKLGNPSWPALSALKPDEVSRALEDAVKCMAEKGIDFLYDEFADPSLVYFYLCHDVLAFKVDDMDIPGMRTVFFYEAAEE